MTYIKNPHVYVSPLHTHLLLNIYADITFQLGPKTFHSEISICIVYYVWHGAVLAHTLAHSTIYAPYKLDLAYTTPYESISIFIAATQIHILTVGCLSK